MAIKDETGNRYGRLLVTEYVHYVLLPNLNTMDGIRSRIDRKRSCWATV